MTVEPGDLAKILTDLARRLESQRGVPATLEGIVQASIGTVPGAQQAGVSLIRAHHTVESMAPSHEVVRRCDEIQSETGEGPCIDAIWDAPVVSVPNLEASQRWPRFAPAAAELGMRSMLSFRLFVEADRLGALNLYSGDRDAFTEESEHVGHLFAAHAALGLVAAQRREQFATGLASRDLIGQAKGILMERHRINGDTAFLVLSKASQDNNVKLRTVAEWIVSHAEASHRPGTSAGDLTRAPRPLQERR